MADNFNFVQVQDLYLAGSGVGATDTTIILKSFKYVDDTNVVMADFGTLGFMTLDPNTSREENISFTGITQNADGTATLTGVTRGLKNKAPYDADTTLRKSHSGSSVAVVSNSAPFYNKMTGKDNDETVTGVWTFANNTFYLGDDTNTDKEFRFLTGSANNPAFKFNATENQMEFRRRGETSYTQIPLSLRGVYANYASLPTDGSNGDIAITDDDHKLYVYDSDTTTWVLSGGSSGAGTMYKTVKYGTEADGDDNKTFTLTAGSWPDEKFLLVYKNGVLMENNASGDYTVIDSNTIEFTYAVEDTDKIVMIVVSVDLYNPEWGLVNADILPDTDNAYDIGSSTKEFKDLYLQGDLIKDGVAATSTPTANAIPIADGSGKLENWVTPVFGGSGVDGALTISSGATTIDLGGVSYLEKNYISISITGTGSLAFSNPHANGTIIVLKSQGDVTITSSASPAIDLRSLGGASATDGSGLLSGPNKGGAATQSAIGVGGSGLKINNHTLLLNKGVFNLVTGAGGGSATYQTSGGWQTPFAGGRGAGALYIESKGSLNFSGAILATGAAGSSQGSSSYGAFSGGGGGAATTDGATGTTDGDGPSGSGGGGGGTVVIISNTITANTGTITVTGGAGGTGGGGAGGTGWKMIKSLN